MSLFQNTVTLFYVISLVSCVSSFMVMPTEVTAGTEIVKDNNINQIIMPALLQRVNMDYIDGGKEKARMKKSVMGELEVARRMGPSKLMKLVLLAFRNMFSTELIEGEPPIQPIHVGKTVGEMLHKKLELFKLKKQKPEVKT